MHTQKFALPVSQVTGGIYSTASRRANFLPFWFHIKCQKTLFLTSWSYSDIKWLNWTNTISSIKTVCIGILQTSPAIFPYCKVYNLFSQQCNTERNTTNMRKIAYSHYVLIMFCFPGNERYISLIHCRRNSIFRFLDEYSYNILLINVLF